MASTTVNNQINIDLVNYCLASDIVKVTGLLDEYPSINVDYENKRGCTPLIAAAQNDDVGIIKLLVDKKVDVNYKTKKKRETALMWATWTDRTNAAKCLVENGADIEDEDEFGKTILFLATHRCNFELVKFFLGKGADLEHKSKKGDTAITEAQTTADYIKLNGCPESMKKVWKDNGKILKFLLEWKQDHN